MTDEFVESLKKELAKTFVTKEEFATPQKFSVTGDASGLVEIAGGQSATMHLKVNKALTAKLAEKVLDVPTVRKAIRAISSDTADVASRCTGNAKTAAKLQDVHSIIFGGDVSGEVSFDGSQDVIVNVHVKNSESAVSDEHGNNIVETYAKKSDLLNMEFQITEYEGNPCLFIVFGEKMYRFMGEEVIFDDESDT